ncbi:hypothetical protein [Actinomadura sp. 9N407]|uniref:hypothetical protein n=1 Tax=Actinomadura sp. 9N407 TaxID=3375154 RepID=UPI00378E6D48
MAEQPNITAHDLPLIPPSPGEQLVTVRAMRERYGVLAWYGQATGAWWALAGGRLVEGQHPQHLAEVLDRGRGWAR